MRMMDKENEQWCASSLSISKPLSQELMKKTGDVSLSMTKRTGDRASNATVRPLGMSARGSNNPSMPLRQTRTTSKQDGLSTPIQGSSQGAQRVLLGNHSDIYLSLWNHSSKEGGAAPLLASPLSCDLVNSTAIGPIQHREGDSNGSGLAEDAARVDATNAAVSKMTPRMHQIGQGGTFRKSSETRSPRAAVPGAIPSKADQIAPKPPKTPLPPSTAAVGSGGLALEEYAHILKWEPTLRPVSTRKEPTRKEAGGVFSGRMANTGDATLATNSARTQQQLASSATDPSSSATEKRIEGSRKHANKSPSRSRTDASQGPVPITGRAPRDSDSGRRHVSKKEEDPSPLASDRAPPPASSISRGRVGEEGAMGSGVQGRNVSTRATKAAVNVNARKPKGSYGVLAELGALRVKVSASGGLSKSMTHHSDSDEEDTSPLEVQTSSGATIRRSSADSPIKRTPSVTRRSPSKSSSSLSSSTEPATTSTEREGVSPARAHRKGGRASAGMVPGSAAVERLLERSSIAKPDADGGRGGSRTAVSAAATARKRSSADPAGAEDQGGDAGYSDEDSSDDDMSITEAIVVPRRVSRHPGGAPGVSKKPGKMSTGPTAPPVVSLTPVTPAANGGERRAAETREARASAARSAARSVAATASATRRGEERPEKSSESSRSSRAGSGIASPAVVGMKPSPGSALPPAGVEPSESKRNGTNGGVDSSNRILGGVAVGGNTGSKTAGPSQEAYACGMPSGSFGSFETVVVQGKQYLKTVKIGRGGSSEVFRVLSCDGRMLALKTVKVDVRGEHAEVLLAGYANEIELLRSLQGSPYIIHLENAEVDRGRGVINIVLELGETDLSRVIKQVHSGDGSETTRASRANFMRHLWDQMLRGVHAMHEDRVVHGDLKPANFVFVQTRLKLIDFGIAKAISNDTTNISRDSQVGTLNYMSPEAFKDTGKGGIDPLTGKVKPMIKLGRASDIWSLGCMLYQMTFGQPPFSHLGIIQKVHAITNPDYVITFPPTDDEALLDTLRSCLERTPQKRPSIAGAGGLLSHRYLNPAIKDGSAEAAAVEARLSTIRRMESAITAKVHEIKRRERDLESRVAAEVKNRMAATVGRQ